MVCYKIISILFINHHYSILSLGSLLMNSDYGNNTFSISSTASPQNSHQTQQYYSHLHQLPQHQVLLSQGPTQQDFLTQPFHSPNEQNVMHFVTPLQSQQISDPIEGHALADNSHFLHQHHNLYVTPSESHQQHHAPVTYMIDNSPQRTLASVVHQQSPHLIATVTPPSQSLSSSLNLFAHTDHYFHRENQSSCAVVNSQNRPSSAPACTQHHVSPLQVEFQSTPTTMAIDIHHLPQAIVNPSHFHQPPVVVSPSNPPPSYTCRKGTIDYPPATHTTNPSGDESYQPVVLPLPVLNVQSSVGSLEYPQNIEHLTQPNSSSYRLTHLHESRINQYVNPSNSESSHSSSIVETNPVQQTAHVILHNPHFHQPVQQFCPVHSVPVDPHLVQHQLATYPYHNIPVEMMANPHMQHLHTQQLHHLPTTEGTQCDNQERESLAIETSSEDDDKMRLAEFGKKFKEHRIQFGYTPADVAQLINTRSGSTGDIPICEGRVLRFESGSLSLHEMQRLVMMMEVFLMDVGWADEEQFKELTKNIYNPKRGRKKRTLIESHHREKLEEEFNKNSRPTVAQLNEIANRVGMDKGAVRIWFCNKRQKLRQKAKEDEFYEGEDDLSSQNVPRPGSDGSGCVGNTF